MTQEQKIINAREFASLLLSCQLAVEFNKDKPNKALKHTLKRVRERVSSEQIKLVCKQGMASPFPVGWLSKQLNNIGRVGGYSTEEFIKIGASL